MPKTSTNDNNYLLETSVSDAGKILHRIISGFSPQMATENVGIITYVGPGILKARGLDGAMSQEMVELPGRGYGIAFDLQEGETGIVVLDEIKDISAGDEVRLTGNTLSIPVGGSLIGRVINGRGMSLDAAGNIQKDADYPLEKSAPAMLDRLPVTVPLQTGIKIIDALIPIGRGQRELIVGDRQTGKTAVAVDTILSLIHI